MSPRHRSVKPSAVTPALPRVVALALNTERRRAVALAVARRMRVRRPFGRSVCLICRQPVHVDGKTGVELVGAPAEMVGLANGRYHARCVRRAVDAGTAEWARLTAAERGA